VVVWQCSLPRRWRISARSIRRAPESNRWPSHVSRSPAGEQPSWAGAPPLGGVVQRPGAGRREGSGVSARHRAGRSPEWRPTNRPLPGWCRARKGPRSPAPVGESGPECGYSGRRPTAASAAVGVRVAPAGGNPARAVEPPRRRPTAARLGAAARVVVGRLSMSNPPRSGRRPVRRRTRRLRRGTAGS
jgi:hypothetical protein